MTLREIEEQLVELQPELAEANDYESSVIINKLLGLLESSCSIAASLAETVQRQKDEINKLKGEDGKAQIKAAAGGSYSTDKERKAAEPSSEPPAIGFRLTKDKLTALREKRIPEDVLDILTQIKNKSFSSESEFMEAVTNTIGKERADKYRELLLKYGRYKKRNRKNKVEKIEIDRTEECKIDKAILPEDAHPNGYEENIVQDIIIKRDNVKFRKEVFYSPSMKKTFTAKVPVGYEGGYGPYVKAEILSMKYINIMSEPKILTVLRAYGMIISPTYISDRLTSPVHMQPFIEEKDQLFTAALEVSSYQQIDDTSCRVNGVNQYVQILCNDFYTAFFTTPRKDRLTILDILRNFKPRRYIFNDDTFHYLEIFNVSDKTIGKIRRTADANEYNEDRLNNFLCELFPDPNKGKNTKTRIKEAAAIAHYHQGQENEIVNILIADDAKQFKLLTAFLGLCWVHMGRHFKKLNPLVPRFQKMLAGFQSKFWTFYGRLRVYQRNVLEIETETLKSEFDNLFSTKTGYPELDERIEKTKSKKNELLLVLKYPEIPLHNNRSENGARVEKRRQDVSLQTKSEAGTIAKDAMMSDIETCKKLDINPRDFIIDRILQRGEIPKLGDLIRKRGSP